VDPARPSGDGVESEDRGRPDATRILRSLVAGDAGDASDLVDLVYAELRDLAERYLARERADHTLQPTALVHEAWIRLIDQTQVEWQGRAHFLGIAAQAMRRILVDHARGRAREKRAAPGRRVEVEIEEVTAGGAPVDVLGLDRALDELRGLSERQAKVVELRVFGALEEREIACALGVSESTVQREWRFARAWLAEALASG